MSDEKPQSEKFKEAARALECDEDEARWNVRLKKVAEAKPAPKKPE
jgi:hypothetical protein